MFTEIPKLMRVEIGSQICDDGVGEAKTCRISQMKLTTRYVESVAIGLYSIHLVNLSMATNMCVKSPGAVVRGPIMSRPSHANGYEGGMVMRL
jgi:hypothetical protein